MTNVVSTDIQRAIEGQYQLSFGAMVTEGWQKVYGCKKHFFAALGWSILASLCMALVLSGFEFLAYYFDSLILVQSVLIASDIGNALLQGILVTGLFYLMLRHINGEQIKGRMVFSMNHMFLSVLILCIDILLIIILFCVLIDYLPSLSDAEKFNPAVFDLIIMAEYLFFLVMIPLFMYFSTVGRMIAFLIVDKKLTTSNACKIAIKAVNQKWIKNILIQIYLIVLWVLLLIPIIVTLGVALIWMYPLMINIQVIWYKQMFNTTQSK